MHQPDFVIAGMRAMAAATPTRPAAPVGGAVAGFGNLMNEVQGDVGDFIAHGAADSADFAPALSVEGSALRALATAPTASEGPDTAQQQFLESIAPWAQQAGERLGVAPHLVAAHAALESGWGQRPLRQGGADSHNLFGIKAGGQWRGDVATAATTEYEHGVAVGRTERFRSYPDQGAAFDDYAQMLLANPRYRAALGTGADAHAFAQGLARGGYATDPAYGAKLARLAGQLRPHPVQRGG
ncbi:MAG: flagellar assembly peptidoglycan hydrolase FlgJ [Massilia sp.]|jgi:flagellar protein FlgJ|nr:flagellar assembly peptidoglycan hydrolase FlgJ [Massilia sp.]